MLLLPFPKRVFFPYHSLHPRIHWVNVANMLELSGFSSWRFECLCLRICIHIAIDIIVFSFSVLEYATQLVYDYRPKRSHDMNLKPVVDGIALSAGFPTMRVDQSRPDRVQDAKHFW